MPINQISSATVPQSFVSPYWEYPADSDAGPIPVTLDIAIEAWPGGSANSDNAVTGTVTVTNGSPDVTGQGGSNFTAILNVGDQVSFGLPTTTTFYTILSVTSDSALVLSTNYGETSASGIEIYGPFNRPPTYAQAQAMSGDVRANILVADSLSGLPIQLWEVWYPSYDPPPGAGWQAGFACVFDLQTGDQRLDGLTGTCTGGTPCMPFLVRYDEAASGTINHPLRGVIHTALGQNQRCIWPCTHAASTGGSSLDYTQGVIPTGSVLRLNAEWITANLSSFPAIVRPIVTAMGVYGCHVNDYTSGTPMEIDWTQDSRWSKSDILTIWEIPIAEFEVVDTIKPQYTLTGPASTATVTEITFTITYVGGSNANFGPITMSVMYSLNGGTVTSTGQSVVLSSSSLSGTCSWTPPEAGNYAFSTYQSSGVWWVRPPDLLVSVDATSRSLTSTQNGRWDDPATWGGVSPPMAGDSATVAHAVLMLGDVTLGTGAATTCLTVATGSLTVVGCKLTLRGNATIGQTSGSSITASPLTVLSSAGNAAGIELDGSSGITPTISVANDTLITFTGTAATHVFLRTKSGTSGYPGIIVNNGTARSWFANFTWCDFLDLGGGSVLAITAPYIATSANLTNPPWIMDHCSVTSCGQISVGIHDGAVNFQILNTTFNTTTDSGGQCLATSASGPITGAGIRLINQSLFHAYALFYAQGCSITECYFDGDLLGPKSNPQWAQFDGCFVHKTTTTETQMGGGWSNCFWLYDPPSGSLTNPWPTVLMGQYSSCSAENNVYQSLGTAVGGGGNCMSGGENVSYDRTLTRTNNILLPNAVGDQSAIVMNAANDVGDTNYPVDIANHNTVYMGTGIGALCGVTTKPELTGNLQSFKNNLFWTDTPQSPTQYSGYIISTQENSPYSYLDPCSGANADYNAAYGAATVPPGTWTSPCTPANGTYYNLPLTTAPGVHDVTLSSAPPFADATRNFQSWDLSLGGAGTVASALARVQANLTLVKTSLLPYIQAGFTLTGAGPLIDSASDGFNRGYDSRAT